MTSVSTKCSKTYNWGIIGCGRISSDFSTCLLASSRASIVACASKTAKSALNFAKKFGIPSAKAYSSYEDIVKDTKIDIIYIGNITPSHCSSTLLALNNGKHVLCEKPIAINARELQAMINAAQKNNRFFCEALWTRFFPAMKKARQLIASGVIGDVISYTSDLGVKFPLAHILPNIWSNECGGGALLNIGCYPINPLTWVFGSRMPQKIKAIAVLDEHDIDTITTATLIYNNKQFAQINTNMFCKSSKTVICGTRGILSFASPIYCPSKFSLRLFDNQRSVISDQDFYFPKPCTFTDFKYSFNFPGSDGLLYEANAVMKCIDDGRLESSDYTWEEMLVCTQIMDEIRLQIGLKYEQDVQTKYSYKQSKL